MEVFERPFTEASVESLSQPVPPACIFFYGGSFSMQQIGEVKGRETSWIYLFLVCLYFSSCRLGLKYVSCRRSLMSNSPKANIDSTNFSKISKKK